MCPTMDGLQSDVVLSCGGSTTPLRAHRVVADLEAVRSASNLGDHFRRSPGVRSGVSTVVADNAPLLLAVEDPERARSWSSAAAPFWDQSGSRSESRPFGKLGTQRMEWQMKGSTWDCDLFKGGLDATRRTHGNDQHQWGVQDDGVLYSGFGTTQKGHHLPTPSSSGTTGSLDSASSNGFPAPTGNCSNGLLLAPCTIEDPGKVRNEWLFADNKDEKNSYQLNGGTVTEYAPPKASITNESACSSAAATKRTACEEPVDHHQVRISRGAGESISKVSPSRPAKKHRIVAPGVPRCQVEGCRIDLTSAKDYHRRHKVCEDHAKAPKILAAGIEQRFCQQCSRFHALGEFDDAKKSCRRRLAGHNERRRKSSQDTPGLSIASMFQDGGRHLNTVLDRSYFMQHPLAMPLSVYQNGDARRTWSKAFELEQQVAMACRGAQLLNGERQSVPPSYAGADRQMMILQPFKDARTVPSLKYMQGSSSLGEGLAMAAASSSSQGPSMLTGLMEAAASSVAIPPGSHPGMLDSGRALSLLSSQALPSPNRAALENFVGENGASLPLQQYPINHSTSVPQSTFPALTDIPQKRLTLPSSPRSIGLSIGMSASMSEDQRHHVKPLESNLNAVHNLRTNPLLAQMLQRPEFRSLGCSSSHHTAKPTLDLMELPPSNSQHNYERQFATPHEMQDLQSLRGYDASVFNAHPNVI